MSSNNLIVSATCTGKLVRDNEYSFSALYYNYRGYKDLTQNSEGDVDREESLPNQEADLQKSRVAKARQYRSK